MKKIISMRFGSHVYGTNLPSSDADYKVVFLPNPRDIILGKGSDAYSHTTKTDMLAKNINKDEETEYFSVKKYINLLIKGQTVALDMFFTPDSFYQEEPHPLWLDIKSKKKHWLHSDILSYIGYACQQANRYGIRGGRVAAARAATEFFAKLIEDNNHQDKCSDHWNKIEDFVAKGMEFISIVSQPLKTDTSKSIEMLEVCGRKVQKPASIKEAYKVFKRIFDEYGQRALQAENNENVDWKATMHAIRVCNEAKELLTTSNVTFPRPEKDLLLQIRQGLMPYKQVAEMIETGMLELEEVQKNSKLPKTVDKDFVEMFLYDAYLAHIKDELDLEAYDRFG